MQGSSQSLAQIDIGDLSLLLPHNNIATVELNSGTAQAIAAFGTDWPIVSLSEQLLPDNTSTSARPFLACIIPKDKNQRFALACDSVESLQIQEQELKQLPAIMRSKNSPIIGILHQDKTIFCITDANYLSDYLSHQQNTVLIKECL